MKLAISHTFRIDVVASISAEHLQKMTAQSYNFLLQEHALHREKLLDAFKDAVRGYKSCSCLTTLKKDIQIRISERPFLDKDILESCAFHGRAVRACGVNCAGIYTGPYEWSKFVSSVMKSIRDGGSAQSQRIRLR